MTDQDDHPNTETSDDRWLEERLVTAFELLDADAELDLAGLCADRPELMPVVAEALGLRQALPELQDAASTAEPDSDRTGQLLADRYRLGEPIGRGAAGTVFEARDEQLGRDVAVKIVRSRLFGGVDAEQRFLREAHLLAQLAHRQVVRVHDMGATDDGDRFLVTELLHGQSLQTILATSQAVMADGPSAAAFGAARWLTDLLPQARLAASYLRQVITWCAELGEGLSAAHALGICHRDVKPSNAFVRSDGSAALLDFGIAARPQDPAVTLEHAIVGTPCYMAPEQASGRTEPAPTIDIYGLTATLYHLLTLQPPHQGDFTTVLLDVRTRDPEPAAWIHQGLPRDLQAILDKGLERSTRARYQTMDELVADLRAFLDHRPVTARPLSGLQRTWRKARRQPARFAAVALGLLLVITLSFVGPVLFANKELQLLEERNRLLGELPAMLSIEGHPPERLLVPADEHHAALASLDRLIELEPTDPAMRLQRAAQLQDLGDHAAAARDMHAINDETPTNYTREVARRYDDASSGRGIACVSLEALPEPLTDIDILVAGFHQLRARDLTAALETLNQARNSVPVRYLRLLALLGQTPPDLDELLSEADSLEDQYGFTTRRIEHVKANVLLLRRNYAGARQILEAMYESGSRRHGTLLNLGVALLNLGHLVEARDLLERAVALRPWKENSRRKLSNTLRELDLYEEAREVVRARDESGELYVREVLVEYELAGIDLARAFDLIVTDRDAAGQAMLAAAERYEHIGGKTAGRMAIAARLFADGDDMSGLALFIQQITEVPLNPTHLGNLVAFLNGEELSGEAMLRLRKLLVEIALRQDPEDQLLKKQLRDIDGSIKELTNR